MLAGRKDPTAEDVWGGLGKFTKFGRFPKLGVPFEGACRGYIGFRVQDCLGFPKIRGTILRFPIMRFTLY